MASVLDLSVILTTPPAGSDPGVLASIVLRCDTLGLSQSGDVLTDPLTKQERADLQWYLEEYWQWPYEQFLVRGKAVEDLLPEIGKRLYGALFGSVQADRIVEKWLGQPEAKGTFQLSIISDLPVALSLPWELLHSEQGYLALRTRRPVSIVRRLPQSELTCDETTTFTPPLRILLVTARPEGTGFIDPRSSARPLFEEMQEPMETGAVAIEILRPPTLAALRDRLKDSRHPVHVLHFDGHGTFGKSSMPQDGQRKRAGAQGKLAFEDTDGKLALVEADTLAQVLQDSGVCLAILDACQSAMGSADDAFSSVAARLIQGGIDAVIAMSASVLVASSTRYMGALYRALAQGTAVPLAQERARQALHDDPRRHLLARRSDEEGEQVELADWWLPHYYQQRPLVLSATRPARISKTAQPAAPPARLSEQMPAEPRYRFYGRNRELWHIERWLREGKLIVIAGFGGMGKTALAREAADWLTRTGMYEGACFASFEGGQATATSLLSRLSFFLGVYDATYSPDHLKQALAQLQPILKKRRILLIADNLESIVPSGEAPLDAETRTQLWNVLVELQRQGAGVLLTSRTTAFGDGRLAESASVVHLPLAGLAPDDAYALAGSLLNSLRIDRRRAPYALLKEVLVLVDFHPLSIQLVLSALRSLSLLQIKQDFAALLPQFSDDTTSGRNRSLQASLEYSIERLSDTQQAWLPRLAVFEGGAMEDDLLAITEIPEAEWASLLPALEQAALLTVEHLEGVFSPFLHFHPVLVPFLRGLQKASDKAILTRYGERYWAATCYYSDEDSYSPIEIRWIVQRELPNLCQALLVLLEAGQLDEAVYMATQLGDFLVTFGLRREQEHIQQRIAEMLTAQQVQESDLITSAEYLHETNCGEQEWQRGQLQAARIRFERLLARIEAQPKDCLHGPGSYPHVFLLKSIGLCFRDEGNFITAEQYYRQAVRLVKALVRQEPESRETLQLQAALHDNLGDVLRDQGYYEQAKAAHEHSLQIKKHIGDQRGQSDSQGSLGMLALEQGEYIEARSRFQTALTIDQAIGDLTGEAIIWHHLGKVAREEQNWLEAERCYRTSLLLCEQLGDLGGAARNCNHLGTLALRTNRFEEAKGWHQRAFSLSERINPNCGDHAIYLCNLAGLLVQEVQARGGQETSTQLARAQQYVEQALAIDGSWISHALPSRFGILATIAELQGHPEAARALRRQERAAHASFAGYRYQIDQQWNSLYPALAQACDDEQMQVEMQEVLAEAETNDWHLTAAMQRLWAGERDWLALSDDLDNDDALVILRVLEILATPLTASLKRLITPLPQPIREALAQNDQTAFDQAFAALSAEEQQQVTQTLQTQQVLHPLHRASRNPTRHPTS